MIEILILNLKPGMVTESFSLQKKMGNWNSGTWPLATWWKQLLCYRVFWKFKRQAKKKEDDFYGTDDWQKVQEWLY